MVDVSRETSVTLQFSAEAGFTSWLIRYLSHGDYSHVDFVLPDGRLLGALPGRYGNVPPGVQIRPANYTTWTRTLRITVPTDKAPMIYRTALLQRTKPYDWQAVLAFALPVLRRGRRWRDPRSWFCAEIGAWAFECGGFFAERQVALPPNMVTPGDLLLLLKPFAVG